MFKFKMCICLTVIFCVQRRDAQHKEIFSPELIAGGAQPGTDRKLVLSKTKLGIQGFCTYSVFKIIVGFFEHFRIYSILCGNYAAIPSMSVYVSRGTSSYDRQMAVWSPADLAEFIKILWKKTIFNI